MKIQNFNLIGNQVINRRNFKVSDRINNHVNFRMLDIADIIEDRVRKEITIKIKDAGVDRNAQTEF